MKDGHSKEVLVSYKKIARWYDTHRSRELFEKPWLDKATAHLKRGATILDLGCGMGDPIARYFIDQGYQVTGVDGCQEFIAMAHERFPRGEFLTADMRDLSLKSRFDAIVVWDSLFHLTSDEQCRMFYVFAKHIKANGVLLFTTGPAAGEVWSDNGGENLYHASLSPEEYKGALQKHGFTLLDYEIKDEACRGHTVWLAQSRKEPSTRP